MFVLAWLEGERGAVSRDPAVPLSLPSPLQGVEPRPIGPGASGASLRAQVDSRVGGDVATTPASPQATLVVTGSIWLET